MAVSYQHASRREAAEADLEQIAQTRSPVATSCIALQSDLSVVRGAEQLVRQAVEAFSTPIDIFVDNPDFFMLRSSPNTPEDQWNAQVTRSVQETVQVTQTALNYLSNPSRIVNICTLEGPPDINGTKTLIETFTREWAM